jgi:shikimate kinase
MKTKDSTFNNGLYLKPLVFVGMMGCGKTTIGKIIAKKLSVKFFDLDEEIERNTNMKISDIFQKYGEDTFRRLEAKTLYNLLPANLTRRFVLSIGGGAFTSQANIKIIGERAISIFLDTNINIIYSRIAGDENRPLSKNKEQIIDLYNKRLSFYKKADFIIKSDTKHTKKYIVNKVLSKINEF